MERYNYLEAVKEDVKSWIYENYEESEIIERMCAGEDSFAEELNDSMWTADSVTGNGSGSYTFSTWKAEENLLHNWDEIEKVCAEWGIEPKISDSYEYGAEYWDVTIRCFYLNQAIAEVLDEITDSFIIDVVGRITTA